MFVLVLAFGLHQQVFTGHGQDAIRFQTYEQCAAKAKTERERLRPVMRGEYTLYCLPESAVR